MQFYGKFVKLAQPEAKIYHSAGALPQTPLGAYSASPNPLAVLERCTSKRRERGFLWYKQCLWSMPTLNRACMKNANTLVLKHTV